MDEQKKFKLKALESETYELYYRHDENYTPQKGIPNIDEYIVHGGGNWIDIDGDNVATKAISHNTFLLIFKTAKRSLRLCAVLPKLKMFIPQICYRLVQLY